MRVELLRADGCPHATVARRVVQDCLALLGVSVPIVDTVGHHPSPTVLIDGRDVMGAPAELSTDSCRLDLPTIERVLAAMRASLANDEDQSDL